MLGLFHEKPALLIGRKALGREPTMSATVMNSIFSPYTVAKGSLSRLIELELNGLNHNYDKLVFSGSQFLSGLFPLYFVIES